jgi:crotonobetainyl-CoA:carnitine CoA-transferase CaiB-like acyl-CoA transferase
LLAGLNVLNLGVGMAPALVAKMMADFGSDVTWPLSPTADPFETLYPAYKAWRGCATVEPDPSPERLEVLLNAADLCIIGGEDHPDVTRRNDASALLERYPRLVVLDINQGPADTRFGDRPITDLIAQARSGLAWEQRPDRPVLNAFEPGSYGAAFLGMIGALAAVYERETSGHGQVVTTSLFEGALSWIGIYWATLEKPTPASDFVLPRGAYPLVFRARDGIYVHIVIGGAGSKYGIYQALEIDDPTVLPTDSGMPKPGGDPRNFFGDYDLLAEHVARKDSREVLEAIWARGLPAEPALSPGGCWDHPQLKRNNVVAVDDDGTRHVGLPIIAKSLSANAPATSSIGSSPLGGLRVIDCGAFLAGPLSGVVLADLGADVIKVETPTGDPNRSIFKAFSVANRGKRGIAIDLKSVGGREIMQRLCKSADVVMNNFRPGVSTRLGVDPAALFRLKPELVVLESPAYGSEGPLALRAGFDMVMQAWCGHEVKAGAGGPPLWNRTNLVDVAGGMLGAVAMLAGLVHRARTGNGAALESSLLNAGVYMLSELIQQADGVFAGATMPMPDHSGYHPTEALYQTSDGWVAIVARGETAISALRNWAYLDRSTTFPDEISPEDEVKLLASVFEHHSTPQLQNLLEPLGIWVEPCIDQAEKTVLNDPDLEERGLVRATDHPVFGKVRELGPLFTLSRSCLGNKRAAPQLGQATDEILPLIGYDRSQIIEFRDSGVII